ncbi:MAG: hypothetical protein H6581_10890 [Bacteroidia bacterium]|nr:hypothetical protein [Bacteroidia bacterium]
MNPLNKILKKRLFKWLAWLTGLVIILFLLLQATEWRVPYYWGDFMLRTKMIYTKKHWNEYDTWFVGSSRVYRQLDPMVFDSLTHRKSMNLGVPGFLPPENFYFLEHLLEDNLSPGMVIIFELQAIQHMAPPEKLDTRRTYPLSTGQYLFIRDYFQELRKPDKIPNYTRAFLHKTLKTGMLKELLTYTDDSLALDTPLIMGPLGNGFYALDQEMVRGKPEQQKGLQRRFDQPNKNKNLLALEKRLEIEKADYLPEVYSRVYLDKLLDLISRAEAREVKLLILYPPALQGFSALTRQIPSSNLLNFNDPREYPELYQTQYHFDKEHLNEKGARLFTSLVARKFLQKMETGEKVRE